MPQGGRVEPLRPHLSPLLILYAEKEIILLHAFAWDIIFVELFNIFQLSLSQNPFLFCTVYSRMHCRRLQPCCLLGRQARWMLLVVGRHQARLAQQKGPRGFK